jgi:hypothetical protein
VSRHIGIPLAGLLILSLAASAHADFRGRGREREGRTKSFAISTEFSGYLGTGPLVVDGVAYRVDPDVIVYVIGQGGASPDLLVSSASIYIAGDRDEGVPVVRTIIVRPAAIGSLKAEGKSTDVRVRRADAPR